MAQPKPAFYLAVFAVVAGLVGYGLWRYKAADGKPGGVFGTFSKDELGKGVEAPDSQSVTTAKEYNYVPAAKLPPVQGISSYKPMNDRTVRFALNVWAGWAPIIFANKA